MAPVLVIPTTIVSISFVMAIAVIRLVPAGFHEVYGAIAGVVPVAIPGPVLGMTRWNMQVHGFDRCAVLTDDQHWLGIDNLWRRGIAELHLTIDTRADLTAYTQVNDGRPGTGRQTGEGKDGKKCGQYDLHDFPFRIVGNITREPGSPLTPSRWSCRKALYRYPGERVDSWAILSAGT
jgi:hypothetical protein